MLQKVVKVKKLQYENMFYSLLKLNGLVVATYIAECCITYQMLFIDLMVYNGLKYHKVTSF